MKKIRWGMIGCGDVTERKNGPGLYKCRDSELFGVTNRTISRAHDWVKRHGHGTVFSGVAELLACPDIDIVYAAATPDIHKELALRVAAAGKHCYLEKPIAPDYRDADEFLGRGSCPSTLESAMRAFKICCDVRQALNTERS
jgi:predicted dehydrogenase